MEKSKPILLLDFDRVIHKYPVQIQIPISYEMRKELKKIAKERDMSLSELVRYWLAGSIKYWRES